MQHIYNPNDIRAGLPSQYTERPVIIRQSGSQPSLPLGQVSPDSSVIFNIKVSEYIYIWDIVDFDTIIWQWWIWAGFPGVLTGWSSVSACYFTDWGRDSTSESSCQPRPHCCFHSKYSAFTASSLPPGQPTVDVKPFVQSPDASEFIHLMQRRLKTITKVRHLRILRDNQLM